MKVNGTHYQTVRMVNNTNILLIDQNKLPFKFEVYESTNHIDTCDAIRTMKVRGAGAIGATAGYAMAQAFLESNNLDYIKEAKQRIEQTRPTAQNLFYATNRVFNAAVNSKDPLSIALIQSYEIAREDAEKCKQIGFFGNELIKPNDSIETHCNAGWLAFVDYGSALSPIYTANRNQKNPSVYVDETRPRNQGAKLTAWELENEDVLYKIIPDNAGAYLMSKGRVDLMIVGADRIASNGDVANKIGTLEKAIVAKEYNVPFYVAAPTSTFDLSCRTGESIPIEQRDENEVLYQTGQTQEGKIETILVACPNAPAINPAFDVTPAKYITGIITEKGVINANEEEIKKLFE